MYPGTVITASLIHSARIFWQSATKKRKLRAAVLSIHRSALYSPRREWPARYSSAWRALSRPRPDFRDRLRGVL